MEARDIIESIVFYSILAVISWYIVTLLIPIDRNEEIVNEQSSSITKEELKVKYDSIINHRMRVIDSIKASIETTGLTATVYHALPSQTNSDPSHTADMTKVDLSNPFGQKIIAVSRDLLKKFPYGTKVFVINAGRYNGAYTVHDTMNKRYKKRIDILINEGMPLGKWTDVKLVKRK